MNQPQHLPSNALSKHRLEALADGIFAVAMTLLVIELKIPEAVHGKGGAELTNALFHLIPKFLAWVISFYVLAIFWMSSNRTFHYVRVIDGRLVGLKLMLLGFASLMPFSSMLAGEYAGTLVAQFIYSLNMCALSIASLLATRYIYRHPELSGLVMPTPIYKAARFRTIGLIFVALLALAVAYFAPFYGNTAFICMAFVRIIGRRIENAALKPTASTANEAKIQSI
jgi:uncharacterized membrane protein